MDELIRAIPQISGRDFQLRPWDGPFSPSELAALLDNGAPFLWLESGPGGTRILLIGELWSIEGFGREWRLNGQGKTSVYLRRGGESCFSLLNDIEKQWLGSKDPALRLGLYLSYEAGWETESRRKTGNPLRTPDFRIFCPQAVLRINGKEGSILSLGRKPDIFREAGLPLPQEFAKGVRIRFSQDREGYISRVKAIKEEIRAGNSFQVNLSQEICAEGRVDGLAWALRLFEREPAPFAAYMSAPGFRIVSNSPERLIRRTPEGRLVTRPIAGTIPRGFGKDEPGRIEEFKKHFKELAEHNMLVDLERNDIGKVSEAGTVGVSEYLSIESYAHLHHLVSEVVGQAKPAVGCGEVIAAMFPGGTITGCPKLETMHILDAVELGERGPYTGSIGCICADGSLDLNILIRSALVLDSAVYYRVGGGIVWDSVPEKEYLETLTKARGLTMSLLAGGADFDPGNRSFRQFFL